MLLQSVSKQWGYLQKQAEKWIYPIPVLEAFIATKTCISNNHSAAGYVGYWTWDKDITTEYAYSWNNYPSYCFMIGKVQQQWGNSWSGYTGVFNWYFPISPSQVYAACLTKHTKNISSSHNWEPARVEEWNNSYVRISPDGDFGYSVIAICRA